jgi:glycosyltransferase involved in cell wall biosynthesis
MPRPIIALVANIAWNLYNFRRGLISALQAEGYDILLIATADDYVERLQDMGCTFVPLRHLSRKGTNPWSDFRLYRELRSIYRQYRPQTVLHYTIKPNIYGTLAAKSASVPSIATITGLGYSFLSTGWVSKLVRRLYRFALAKSDYTIFQNQDDRQLFVAEKLVAESKTLLIRGSGINTQLFAPCPKADEHKNTFIFLFVGRLLYDKGIREFLQAAEQTQKANPNSCQFWIVGALDTQNPSALAPEELQKYVQNNTVTYFGSTDNVKDFIANADTVVLPSYREGLPRVMLEALAMARPIITTDAPGCRDTVQDTQNGFIIPPQDAHALAQAMQRILHTDEPTRQNMGKHGREMAETLFDQNVVINQYLQLLSQIKKNA